MTKHYKKVVGDKVYLSPIHTDDFEKIVEWTNDFRVTDTFGWSDEVNTLLRYSDMMTKRLMDRNNNDFAIIDLATDTFIGICSVSGLYPTTGSGELWIMIGEADYRGKGYGTEVVNLLLDYGFNNLALRRIYLTCAEYNHVGCHVYQKAGFVETGRDRQNWFTNGKYYDTIRMDILRSEFGDRSYMHNKVQH